MISERYDLWETGEYDYPVAFGFIPNLVGYLHEDTEKRPCILVVPGGDTVWYLRRRERSWRWSSIKRGIYICLYLHNQFVRYRAASGSADERFIPGDPLYPGERRGHFM